MSSPENYGGAPLQYLCYQCDDHVEIMPSSSELVCPNCHGGFLELSDTAPPSNPSSPIPNFFYYDNAASIPEGFPFVFPSAAQPGASATVPGGGGFDEFAAASGGRSSGNEFNPLAFLNNYLSSLQSRGANIELIFESREGGGGGADGDGDGDFRLPANLGDYFDGPGLEQLIQQLAENDPNRYGTPPAAKSAVNGLPDIKITNEMLASDSSQCAVCKDSFELNEEAKQIPCNHIYHKDCILPWLELHNSCPVCRYELPTDDPDYENSKTGPINANSTGNSRNSGVGLGAVVGSHGDGDNNSQQRPAMVERQFTISLPWLLRGLGSVGETSNSGREGAGNNDASNNNHGNSGARNTGSGGGERARE